MPKNKCPECGIPLEGTDAFDEEYVYCRTYCCGHCPTKDGYRGESCHKDYIDRKRGLPVGVLENLARF